MKIIKNYKSSLILLMSIFLGGLLGVFLGKDAIILKSFGDIFLNLLLVIIVPLIFLSISTSIYKMDQKKRMGKIIGVTFLMFLVTSIVSVFIGIVSTYSFKLVNISDSEKIKNELVIDNEETEKIEINLLDKMLSMLTVDDFSKLLSRDNIIALIIISLLVGYAMYMSGNKALVFFNLLDSMLDVVNNLIKIIMLYAPIGICCYFASLIGNLGLEIAVGYVKTFIIYMIVSIFVYFVIYGIYVYISAGKKGVKSFFKNIIPSTLTALSTCSSAASIAVNMECSKKIGISCDIVDTTVSVGSSFHKDGSVIGSVFKVMFLVYLFNDVGNISILNIVLISLFASLLVTAVPIGGGTISEMLIISMLGYPVATLPILTVIATIIDAPATVLNVVGDSACAMLTSRIIEGKNWIK